MSNEWLKTLCETHPREAKALLGLLAEVVTLPDEGAAPGLRSKDQRVLDWSRRLVSRVDVMLGYAFVLDVTDVAPCEEVSQLLAARGLLLREVPEDLVCAEAGADAESE